MTPAYYRARADYMRAQAYAYRMAAEAEMLDPKGDPEHYDRLVASYNDMARSYEAMAAAPQPTTTEILA